MENNMKGSDHSGKLIYIILFCSIACMYKNMENNIEMIFHFYRRVLSKMQKKKGSLLSSALCILISVIFMFLCR
jgi:hypothetical protein